MTVKWVSYSRDTEERQDQIAKAGPRGADAQSRAFFKSLHLSKYKNLL